MEKDNETWKKYNDKYEVSTLGIVRISKNKRLLKQNIKHNTALVAIDGNRTPVYKLVADTFIPNTLNFTIIRNKDGDRTNNKLENLERISKQVEIIGSQPTENVNAESKNIETEEIWKEYTPSKYEVSTLGNVKHNGELLNKSINNGYYRVIINNEYYNLAKLIAEVYLTNPHDYKYVSHKDNDKLNNKVENLEWVKFPNKGCKIEHHKQSVLQYKDKKLVGEYISLKEASKATKVDSSQIRRVCQGVNKSAGGFTWSYKNGITHEDEPEGVVFRVCNRYILTRDGRVYSKRNKKFLVLLEDAAGYHYIRISYKHDNKTIKKNFKVHKIIAEHYLEKPANIENLTVNHKNKNKLDNKVENLEWVSLSENIQHSIKTN